MKRYFQIPLMVCMGLSILFSGCSQDEPTKPKTVKPVTADYTAPLAATAPVIDGNGNDACWADAEWADLDQLWLGVAPAAADFTGRYKFVWTADKLYLLAEITDDVLMDSRTNPLSSYWEDDCLEFFIDENNSDGDHQNNYNAFAYHVSVLYDAVDLGADGQPHLFNDHVSVIRTKSNTRYTWEFAFTVYNDTFVYGATNNPTVTLTQGKKLGYALAYCDSDNSKTRESFIGSIAIAGVDKNRAYIDAGIFGTMELVE
ncbi:MAG TPA: CBM9 family sugar-binding protein [bacterium]|nr:CBM9 family sugar-binding protein [bacterium]HPN42103.1 CBM9 family sugar-binding protein [bacterium]